MLRGGATFVLAALATLALVVFVAFRAADFLPPKVLTIAAGAPGSAYHDIAMRYRSVLALDGIDLQIVESAGSVDNIARISAPDDPVDVALVQGGLPFPAGAAVEALAALAMEPLLILHRGALDDVTSPATWEDLRIAIGAEGSGTRTVFFRLMEASESDTTDANTLLPMSGMAASEALLSDAADVAVFVAPLGAPYLAPLFADPRVRLSQLQHSRSLAKRMPQTSVVALPEGGIDYARSIPEREVRLLAMHLQLVSRNDLHPAAVDRLIRAAQYVHGRRTMLSEEGQFPSVAGVGLPVDSLARRLIVEGRSPLSDYMPYWMAAQLDAIAVLLLPVLILLLPLLRALPGLYQWRMRWKVFRYYRTLAEIEAAADDAQTGPLLEAQAKRLADLDRAFVAVSVPAGFRDMAYSARLHTDLVRTKIEARRRHLAASDAAAAARLSDRGFGSRKASSGPISG